MTRNLALTVLFVGFTLVFPVMAQNESEEPEDSMGDNYTPPPENFIEGKDLPKHVSALFSKVFPGNSASDCKWRWTELEGIQALHKQLKRKHRSYSVGGYNNAGEDLTCHIRTKKYGSLPVEFSANDFQEKFYTAKTTKLDQKVLAEKKLMPEKLLSIIEKALTKDKVYKENAHKKLVLTSGMITFGLGEKPETYEFFYELGQMVHCRAVISHDGKFSKMFSAEKPECTQMGYGGMD